MLLEETKPSFTPTEAFSNWYVVEITLIVCALIVLFAIRFYTLAQRPVVHCNKEDKYGVFNLGRLVECRRSERIPDFYEITCKKLEELVYTSQDKQYKKDYRTVYSRLSFDACKLLSYIDWNLGITRWIFLPHFFVIRKKLPQQLQFEKKIIAKGKRNEFIYWLFRILGRSRRIHPYIKYETLRDEKGNVIYETEINMLQLEYMLELTSFEFNTEFERKESFGEEGVEAWIKYPEINIVSLVWNGKEYFIDDGITVAPLQLAYENIVKKLELRKDEFDANIKQKLLKPEDKFFFYVLYQIEDMKRNTKTYRKVVRKGDPKVVTHQILELNQAIKSAKDRRTLISDYEIKLAELEEKLRNSYVEIQDLRRDYTDILLNGEKRLEDKLKEREEKRKDKNIIDDRLDWYFAIKDEVEKGKDIKRAISDVILLHDKELNQKENRIKELENEIKILKDLIKKTISETKISFPQIEEKELNTKTIGSNEDLKKLIEEESK